VEEDAAALRTLEMVVAAVQDKPSVPPERGSLARP
jgi:hypothetical protein